MKICKTAGALEGGTPTPEQLALVNRQSKTPLTAEEVYVFALRLCDDQIDRDSERFATESLGELAALFVGKPGVVDHNWSAEKQAARIFDAQVQQEGGVSWLKAWAYIPRAGRERLIGDIETGIRREISISCSMGRKECSICGGDLGACGHQQGRCYESSVCVGILKEPRDAYEFSFVAVPAQKEAGVVKHWKGGEEMNLKEYVEKSGQAALKQELERLKKEAAYGKARRSEQEEAVARMGVALELGLSRQEMQTLAEGLETEMLDKLARALEKKLDGRYDGKAQLTADSPMGGEKEAYLI